ncbi:hypothetical protein [Nonomuraea sp. NPDC023979]|uniref:hypothetical protein n=1 Tax=Nonomuraea sp. NPDC023979 TaxID=3154796 RepID=UPI0033DE3025
MSRFIEVLYGLRCAECGEEDQLALDVVRALVECRSCGARACSGELEDEPAEDLSDCFEAGAAEAAAFGLDGIEGIDGIEVGGDWGAA